MSKLIIILLAAIFLVAGMIVLSLKIDLVIKSTLLVFTAATITFLFYMDHILAQSQRMKKFNSMESRVTELLKKINESDFIVEIYGASVGYGFVQLLVAALGCFAVIAWGIQGHEIILIAGLLISAFSLMKLFIHIVSRNKLQMAISQQGIRINVDHIDWQEIEDITLICISSSGTSPFYHTLFFTLTDSLSNRKKMAWIPKTLTQIGLQRRLVKSVILGSNNEEPDVVFRVCKALWQANRPAQLKTNNAGSALQ